MIHSYSIILPSVRHYLHSLHYSLLPVACWYDNNNNINIVWLGSSGPCCPKATTPKSSSLAEAETSSSSPHWVTPLLGRLLRLLRDLHRPPSQTAAHQHQVAGSRRLKVVLSDPIQQIPIIIIVLVLNQIDVLWMACLLDGRLYPYLSLN